MECKFGAARDLFPTTKRNIVRFANKANREEGELTEITGDSWNQYLQDNDLIMWANSSLSGQRWLR